MCPTFHCPENQMRAFPAHVGTKPGTWGAPGAGGTRHTLLQLRLCDQGTARRGWAGATQSAVDTVTAGQAPQGGS